MAADHCGRRTSLWSRAWPPEAQRRGCCSNEHEPTRALRGPGMSISLVTGGSRGIGRAVIAALLAEDWTVAFTYHSDESAAREIEAASTGRARGFQLDLRDRARPGDLVREIEQSIGPLDALVNNAGLRRESLLAMTPDREWDDIMDVNLDGAFRCCRAVLPLMMHRRRGSIVNISSLSAVSGVAGQTAYAASKAALLGM